jgi:hypothetical protein
MKWTSSSSPPAPVGLRGVATFGPVVAFGCGGTAVEVVNDKALALPPLDLKLARELIGRTRISKLLAGYCGHDAGDRMAGSHRIEVERRRRQSVEAASTRRGDRLRGWAYRIRTSMCREKIHLFEHSAIFGFS